MSNKEEQKKPEVPTKNKSRFGSCCKILCLMALVIVILGFGIFVTLGMFLPNILAHLRVQHPTPECAGPGSSGLTPAEEYYRRKRCAYSLYPLIDWVNSRTQYLSCEMFSKWNCLLMTRKIPEFEKGSYYVRFDACIHSHVKCYPRIDQSTPFLGAKSKYPRTQWIYFGIIFPILEKVFPMHEFPFDDSNDYTVLKFWNFGGPTAADDAKITEPAFEVNPDVEINVPKDEL